MLPLEPSMNAIKDETLLTAEEMVFKTESTTKAKVIKLPGLFREFYRTSDNPVLSLTMRQNDVTRSLECSNYAPINVKPAGGGRQGMGWGFEIFQKFAFKFPAHGQIIPVKCNQISPTPGCTLLSNIPRQNLRKAQ